MSTTCFVKGTLDSGTDRRKRFVGPFSTPQTIEEIDRLWFVVVARPAEQLQHLHWRPAYNIALTEEEVFRSDTYTSHVSTNLLSGHGPESSRFYCSTYLRIVASDNCPGLLNAAFSFCEPRAGLAVSALHLVCAFFRNSSLPWWVKPEHELKEAARQGIKRAADTNDTTS